MPHARQFRAFLCGILWALGAGLVPATPSDHAVHGLCYGPFRDGQSPAAGIFPSEQEVREDLSLLSTLCAGIRTYGVDRGTSLALIPSIAAEPAIDLDCYPGAWIDDAETDQSQVDSLIAIGNSAPATTLGLVVGNEYLYRHPTGLASLLARISEVRTGTAGAFPITAAEQWHVWRDHPGLASACDLLFVHVHPYWENQPVEDAVSFVVEKIQFIRNLYPAKPVILAETGWPTEGSPRGAAVPSRPNQIRFIRELRPAAETNAIDYLLFSACDEPWKSGYSDVEAHWGILDKDRHDKGAIAILLDIHTRMFRQTGTLHADTFARYPYQLRASTDLQTWLPGDPVIGQGRAAPISIPPPFSSGPTFFYRLEADAP